MIMLTWITGTTPGLDKIKGTEGPKAGSVKDGLIMSWSSKPVIITWKYKYNNCRIFLNISKHCIHACIIDQVGGQDDLILAKFFSLHFYVPRWSQRP